MMTDNFLPDFELAKTSGASRNKLRCQVRGYEVPATPEERVRQRVLHWLINTKSWGNLRLEKAYRWESDPNRSHIRPDIELLDDDENVVVVVECKHEDVPLGKAVDDQAIEYAIKSGAPYIWVTNGEQHGFLEDVGGRWQAVNSIEPLGEEYEPPTGRVAFPNIHDAAEVEYYMNEMDLSPLNETSYVEERNFTLALHKAIFDVLDEKRVKHLPFSNEGVHLLEYAGAAFHGFSNRSGLGYHTRYADFVAATRGRVEAMSVAVNMWDGEKKGIRLCVGVSKAERKHHALQLDFANCKWNERRRCWKVYHNGAMSQVKIGVVLDAVREAGCRHWIDADENHKERVYLGVLPEAEAVTWKNTRQFLANLLHYGIIRTNLREAQAARKAQKRRETGRR